MPSAQHLLLMLKSVQVLALLIRGKKSFVFTTAPVTLVKVSILYLFISLRNSINIVNNTIFCVIIAVNAISHLFAASFGKKHQTWAKKYLNAFTKMCKIEKIKKKKEMKPDFSNERKNRASDVIHSTLLVIYWPNKTMNIHRKMEIKTFLTWQTVAVPFGIRTTYMSFCDTKWCRQGLPG